MSSQQKLWPHVYSDRPSLQKHTQSHTSQLFLGLLKKVKIPLNTSLLTGAQWLFRWLHQASARPHWPERHPLISAKLRNQSFLKVTSRMLTSQVWPILRLHAPVRRMRLQIFVMLWEWVWWGGLGWSHDTMSTFSRLWQWKSLPSSPESFVQDFISTGHAKITC